MNPIFSFFALLTLCLSLGACTSTREYSYNFDQVKAALTERFDRNQWTARTTEYGIIKEPVAGTELTIDYYHYQSPYTKTELEISVTRLDANRCEVGVFGSDYDSWFYRVLNETTLQRSTHDALLQRLKVGSWGPISYEPSPYVAKGDRRPGKTQAAPGSVGTPPPAFGGVDQPPPFTAPAGVSSNEPPPFTGAPVQDVPFTAPADVPPVTNAPQPPVYGDIVEEDIQF